MGGTISMSLSVRINKHVKTEVNFIQDLFKTITLSVSTHKHINHISKNTITLKGRQEENNDDDKEGEVILFYAHLCWILPFLQEIFFGSGKKLLHCN